MLTNPNIGNHFEKSGNHEELIDDEIDVPENELFNDGQMSNSMFEMHRKNLSQALYRLWIHEELKDRKKIGKILFGPRIDESGVYISYQESVDAFLSNVDDWRTGELYEHGECSGLKLYKINNYSISICRKLQEKRMWSCLVNGWQLEISLRNLVN